MGEDTICNGESLIAEAREPCRSVGGGSISRYFA